MASSNNQNGWLNMQLGGGPGVGSTPGALGVLLEQQPSAAASGSAIPGGESNPSSQFEDMERTAGGPAAGSSTLKRNPKMELTKNDLLKLVTYFEGEIQARDVAIAALKSEKLKQVVSVGRYRPAVMSDPVTALLRDSVADGPTARAPVSERELAAAADQQLRALEQLAAQQRRAHEHMAAILREAECKHRRVIRELEEEKCKHEHDTAQGDDITYGLELERTRLRQELEAERTARKRLEREAKRQQELTDEERARQKQIVLLLLAERKKIIVKYIEERKRSEDLAQILSEEKAKVDTMAEGLEEESKKSLQMEAELEKQLNVFEGERKVMRAALATKDLSVAELEAEVTRLQQQQVIGPTDQLASATVGAAAAAISIAAASANNAAMSSSSMVAKVVQPTATVSSVPVSGPTTGIAQSVSGRGVRKPPCQLPAGVGRGIPPPIPPNKPIIPSKGAPVAVTVAVGPALHDKKKPPPPPTDPH